MEAKIEDSKYLKNKWTGYITQYLLANNYDFDVTKRSDETYITIRYEDVLIKNSRHESHLIKEIFVRFTIFNSGVIGHISGAKATYTDLEILTNGGWLHSHLGRGIERGGYFNTFCTGSGEINDFRDGRKYTPSQDNATLFILMLENFLGWESVEGGPYCFMQEIQPVTNRVYSDSEAVNDVFKPGTRKLKIKDDFIDFIISGNKIEVSEKWAEAQLTPKCMLSDGKYYSVTTGNSAENLSNRVKEKFDYLKRYMADKPLVFKGKEVQPRVVPDSKNKVVDQNKLVIHPKTLKEYVDRISKELSAFILEQDRIEGEI